MRTPWEAGVFVYRDDKLLLMHRTDDRYWHVVAGVVEYGEEIVDGALRELREESGLVGVDLLDLGSPVTYPITPELRQRYDYPSDVREVTAYSFAARAPAGWEPTLNEEHDEYRWTSVEEPSRSCTGQRLAKLCAAWRRIWRARPSYSSVTSRRVTSSIVS